MWFPSSAPVYALGHLSPGEGKAKVRAVLFMPLKNCLAFTIRWASANTGRNIIIGLTQGENYLNIEFLSVSIEGEAEQSIGNHCQILPFSSELGSAVKP